MGIFGQKPAVWSAPELAAVWQPPGKDLGARVARVPSRWIDAPITAFIDPTRRDAHEWIELGQGLRSDGTYAPVGINYRDFRYLFHITAPMGRGKSEYLRTIFSQLMSAGAGMMMLDCKGTDLVVNSIPLIPRNRERDVVLLELGGSRVTGEDMRPAMNLLSPSLAASLGMQPSQMASTLIRVFNMLDPRFKDAPSIQNFANNGLLALLEGEPQSTFLHMNRFFEDDDYRAQVGKNIKNPSVADFWLRRFPMMETSEVAPLKGFQRRIDRMLSYPELAAMLIAPGCSIDLRRIMDNQGILLCGIKATEGPIAALGAMFLLMQLELAALSRSNVPEERRPDFPVFIDEAQIVFQGGNEDLAVTMFSQFRAFRIGTVIVHQSLGQLLSSVLTQLGDNAQNRLILGAKENDAAAYASKYGQGTTASDYTNMERFINQYMSLMNSPLFSARMPPMVKDLDEDPPETVYVNWKTIEAPARNAQERELDQLIRYFSELAKYDRDTAIQRLAALPLDAFDAYCARTRMHRLAQWNFIEENPGCISLEPLDPALSKDKARRRQLAQQKDRRIRTMNALRNYIPKAETEALQFRLLYEVQQGEERRAIRMAEEEEAKKAAKRGGKKGGAQPAAGPRPDPVLGVVPEAGPSVPGASPVPLQSETPLPTLQQLMAERGRRRPADEPDVWNLEIGLANLPDDEPTYAVPVGVE